jgi:hypothetical protein
MKVMFLLILTVCFNALSDKQPPLEKNMLYNSSFELGSKGYTCSERINCKSGNSIHDYKGSAMSSDDSTSYAGKKSLKLTLYPKTSISFTSHEVKLDSGKKYTFSFYAKSNADLKMSLYFASVRSGWRAEKRQTIKVRGSDWKRYSYSFTVKHKPIHEHEKYYFLLVNIEAKTAKSQIWLDGIQLQEGKMGEYAPARPVEAAVYSPKMFIDNQEFKGTFEVISYYRQIQNHSMTLSLDDCFFNKTIEKKSLRLDLPKGEAVSKEIHFKSKLLGAFKISCGKAMSPFAAAYFIHIKKPSRKVYGAGFQPGMQAGALEHYRNTHDRQSVYWNDVFGEPGSLAEQIKLTGATWVHSFSVFAPFYIGLIKPEKDKYNWSFADQYVENAEKNNLSPFILVPAQSLLTNKRGKKQGKLMPEWLRKLDRFGKPEGSRLGDWEGICIVLPPPEAIADFFGVMARRYGKRVAGYQLFPEANGYMRPKHIVEYMKHVHKEIKKVNPDAKFIGLTPTGDNGSGFSDFFDECLSLGAADYTDAYSYHPYKTRMDNSPISAMKGNRTMQELNKLKGGKKELWNTELYYLLPVQPEDKYENAYGADAVARRLLIDMGEGLSASSLMNYTFFYENPLLPHQQYYSLFGGIIPSARFAVFSAFARFATGARPIKTLELNNGDVLCYLFYNDGKLFNAIWSVGEKQIMDIPLPEKLNPVIYDIFGNEIKIDKNKLKLELNRNPLYIQWENESKSLNPEIVIKTLQNAKIESKNRFGIIGPRLTVDRDGQLCAGLIIQNNTSVKANGKVRLLSRQMGIKCGDLKYENISPHEKTKLFFPVKLWRKTPEKIEVNILLDSDGQILNIKRTMKKIKRLDIKNDAWTKEIPLTKINYNYQKNSSVENFACAFSMTHNKNDLLMKIKIEDKNICLSKDPKKPWESDSVELFFDLNPLAGKQNHYSNYHDNCFQLIIPAMFSGNKDITLRKMPDSPITLKNIEVNVRKTESGYEMNICLPLGNYIGNLGGKSIAFTLAVNNTDNGVYKYNKTWVGNKNYKDRSDFCIIYFK